ncbi:hypothetical protein L2E82_36654 [Cichorium intybus]|uniref:Uncharacterized protein n=1 Tax=Cichorium intybus TaxID=13427 RepID=A0ACB9ACR0_CICIN|nr:hypothetical protein L2E82_36654 [Cichorium intybus]
MVLLLSSILVACFLESLVLLTLMCGYGFSSNLKFSIWLYFIGGRFEFAFIISSETSSLIIWSIKIQSDLISVVGPAARHLRLPSLLSLQCLLF